MPTTQSLKHLPSSTGKANQPWPRWLPLGAVAGPVLFTAGWVILGAVSPGYTVGGTWISPYSAITQPISGLGLGVTGPYMNSAFIISGLLLLAGVIGVVLALPPGGRHVTRTASSILLGLSPVGLVIIGLFTLDNPAMHLLGAMLILATPVISFLITGLHLRGLPGWHRFGNGLLAAAPLTLVLFVLYTGSFDQSAVAAGHGVAGLTQRLLFVNILTWFAAMGWLAYRHTASSTPADRKH
ncbi:MAG: DUF998 domain-containing protein [Propionibacteriaceae bacterium]